MDQGSEEILVDLIASVFRTAQNSMKLQYPTEVMLTTGYLSGSSSLLLFPKDD